MASFILIAVLAALTVCNDAAFISNEGAPFFTAVVELPEGVKEYVKVFDDLEEATGRQLTRNDNLILFHEESFFLEGIPYTVQHRDVFYRGNSTTFIRRITVISHTNSNTFPEGVFGMYGTYASVRVTSRPGGKLFNTVKIYGRYTDWP